MTANRDIPITAPLNGGAFATNVRDTVKVVSGYVLGNLISPSGTNAITGTIELAAGLDSLSEGAQITFKQPVTNTGAMNLDITNTTIGSKPLVDANGLPFTGGECVAGSSYTWIFHGDTDDHWRLQSAQAIPEQSVDIKTVTYLGAEEFNATGAHTWTAPYRCIARIWAIGAGGSGGNITAGVTTGGGAGGHAVLAIEMASGAQLSISIGAGGLGVLTGNLGNDGGPTTVTGTNINANNDDVALVANGGGGGSGAGSGSVLGGAGGTASGGDSNWQGGSGFDVAASVASGGGGVGFGQDGVDGGVSGGGIRTATGSPDFLNMIFGPFQLGGLSGGPAGSGGGDQFCGGGGDSSGVTGTGGGGGSRRSAGGSSGDGGDGLVVIEYTADLDA